MSEHVVITAGRPEEGEETRELGTEPASAAGRAAALPQKSTRIYAEEHRSWDFLCGGLLTVSAALIFALGNSCTVVLGNEGVSPWAILLLRGAMSSVLNVAVVSKLRGRAGILRMLRGEGEPPPLKRPAAPSEPAATTTNNNNNNNNNTASPPPSPPPPPTHPTAARTIRNGYGIYLRGFFGTVSTCIILYVFSSGLLTFADAFALFFGTSTVMAQGLARVFLKERLKWNVICGALLCIAGIVFVTKPRALFYGAYKSDTATGNEPSALGVGLLVLAGIGHASFVILARDLRERAPTSLLHGYMSVQFAFTGVAICFVLPASEAQFPHTIKLWALLCTYVACMVVALLLSARGAAKINAGLCSVLGSTEVFFAFFAQATILGTPVDALSLGGAGIIFVGAVLAAAGANVQKWVHARYRRQEWEMGIRAFTLVNAMSEATDDERSAMMAVAAEKTNDVLIRQRREGGEASRRSQSSKTDWLEPVSGATGLVRI
jgi:drug/metabolite transporter (DMT)-like permease